MKPTRHTLELKRRGLLKRIKEVAPWIEGSLVSTERKCGKDSCACHHGGTKHPVTFVTWKEDGKTISLYVPKNVEPEVRMWIENHKRLKILIRRMSDVQKDIIRLRESR